MDFQKRLIERRLNDFGLEVVYTPHALHGIEFLKNTPEKRAEDLKWAFADATIKGIICAIGGDDTYKTIPYLLNDKKFINNVRNHPKIFIGYSDSTINHLMFQKLGLMTYYGHAAIVDFGELSKEMLPYSKMWFKKLFGSEKVTEIIASPVWYLERTSFTEAEFDKERISIAEEKGYEVLQGTGVLNGKLFGGCVESLSELLSGSRHVAEAAINVQFELFPSLQELTGKILFLETSEEKITPEKLRELLLVLEQYGIFAVIGGVLMGKPQDCVYYEEYKAVLIDVIGSHNKPILVNMNFGHAHPKCILPYGADVEIDFDNCKVTINEPITLEN